MSRLPRHASPGSEPIANNIKDKAIRSRLSALQHVMEPSPRRASRRSSLEMMAQASRELVTPKPRAKIPLPTSVPLDISLDIALEKLSALDQDNISKMSDKQKQPHKKQYEVPAIGFREPSPQRNDTAFAA
jgi:hypothetical protein